MVHGISFRIRKETRNLRRLFPAERGEEQFHIGTLHCNVGGQDRATDKHAITKCCRDGWAAYPNARGLTVNPEQIFLKSLPGNLQPFTQNTAAASFSPPTQI
jgi:hypothetical protein